MVAKRLADLFDKMEGTPRVQPPRSSFLINLSLLLRNKEEEHLLAINIDGHNGSGADDDHAWKERTLRQTHRQDTLS